MVPFFIPQFLTHTLSHFFLISYPTPRILYTIYTFYMAKKTHPTSCIPHPPYP